MATAAKSKYGPGPWQHEPDRKLWTDGETGLVCLLKRGPIGAWCGYVGLTPRHPLYGTDYSGDDYDSIVVHGGLTYSAYCNEAAGICHPGGEKLWWLGFDCAHAGDLAPGINAHLKSIGLPRELAEVYRTMEYARNECVRLAAQLATV